MRYTQHGSSAVGFVVVTEETLELGVWDTV